MSIDRANRTGLLLVESVSPSPLGEANHLEGGVQNRELFSTERAKLDQLDCFNKFGSVQSMTKLLDRHPCGQNGVSYFRGQSIVEGSAQRVRCRVETRGVEKNVSVIDRSLARDLYAIKERSGTVDRILKESFGICGSAIATTQSIPLGHPIGVPHVHRVLKKYNDKGSHDGEHGRARLGKCQPIPMVPRHA
jgi:hypothetical protein